MGTLAYLYSKKVIGEITIKLRLQIGLKMKALGLELHDPWYDQQNVTTLEIK